jgi:CRISPR/Cas system CMR-associated protein Cmr1 (group 7 of RAMP superfamily)
MHKKIVTFLNYDLTVEERAEKVNNISAGTHMTIPDQAISIQELAENYTRKAIVNLPSFEGIYYGDVEAPDWKSMDAVDRLQYANDLGQWIRDTEQELKQAQAELKADKAPLQEAKADYQKIVDSSVKPQNPEG